MASKTPGPSPIVRLLKWARAVGWTQSRLAQELAQVSQRNVAPQHISNWKTRGLPAEWYAPAAQVMGSTVEELLGGRPAALASPAVREPTPHYLPTAAARAGHELERAASTLISALHDVPADARAAVVLDLMRALSDAQPNPRTVAQILRSGAAPGKRRSA